MVTISDEIVHRRRLLWISVIALALLLVVAMALAGIGPFGEGVHKLGLGFEIASAVRGQFTFSYCGNWIRVFGSRCLFPGVA